MTITDEIVLVEKSTKKVQPYMGSIQKRNTPREEKKKKKLL